MEHHFDGAMTGIVKEITERVPSPVTAVDGHEAQSLRMPASRPRQWVAASGGTGDDGGAHLSHHAEREN